MNYFKLKSLLLIFTVAFAASSCLKLDSDYDKQVQLDDERLNTYFEQNGINPQKHSKGFYYMPMMQTQSGAELNANDVVSFYYTISLLDGTVIETNNLPDKEPAKVKLLSYTIIPEGLDFAIRMMRVGEEYRFFMPSYLAYGSYKSADFDAYSLFKIDVKVVAVHTEGQINAILQDSLDTYMAANYLHYLKTESGLYFVDSISGTGNTPYGGSGVVIDFSRKYINNTLITAKEDVLVYLNGQQAVPGLEEGILLMKQGGEAILYMAPSLAFKNSLCVIPQKTRKELLQRNVISSEVLPYSIVKYVVKLKSVN